MPRAGEPMLVCRHVEAGADVDVRYFRVDPPAEVHKKSGELVGETSWLCVCTSCAGLPGAPMAQAVDWVVLEEDVDTRPRGRSGSTTFRSTGPW